MIYNTQLLIIININTDMFGAVSVLGNHLMGFNSYIIAYQIWSQ